MAKYRKKPVVIEAEQFWPLRQPWPDGVELHPENDQYAGVMTLEGFMTANPGDWIITGVKGEKYPCKDDIFKATYEPAEGILG